MKKIFNTDLSIKNINQEVELYGWISKKRNLGGMLFIDLRDRSGIIQLVVSPEKVFFEELSSVLLATATPSIDANCKELFISNSYGYSFNLVNIEVGLLFVIVVKLATSLVS